MKKADDYGAGGCHNTGSRAGIETVQLYLRDVAGSVVRPVKELKGVQKVALDAGETKRVKFTITEEMLRFYGKNMEYCSNRENLQVMIAPGQQLRYAG
ncbi:MAG: fibronectin type III-like domain-contianing protein [Bacteroides cellulosilyticus]